MYVCVYVFVCIHKYTDHIKFYCFFHILLVLLCVIVNMVVCSARFYLILYITVKPRFTNASDHEQFGLRTKFPNTKHLG